MLTKNMRAFKFCCVVLSACFFNIVSPVWAADPPPQPQSGPGGRDYVVGDIVQKAIGDAKAPVLVYYSGSAPKEARTVIIFMHAWGAVNPVVYGGWIDHLVKKGHLVLWPRHQEMFRTGGSQSTDTAIEALKTAFDILKNDPDARPDVNRVAIVGHLAGAGVAVNVAARASSVGLPIPKIIFTAVPGGLAAEVLAEQAAKQLNAKNTPKAPLSPSKGIPLADLSQISANTFFISAIGDREHQPSERTTRRLFREASQIQPVNKVLLRLQSDDHGYPPHIMNLTAAGSYKAEYDISKVKLPVAAPLPKGQRQQRVVRAPDANLSGEQYQLVQQMERSRVDLADYLGFWKALDLTLIHGFQDQDANGLRNDTRLPDMGRWSNDWPVKRINIEAPKEIAPQAKTTDRATTGTAPTQRP